ncbi:hypothetical protein [Chitinophaga sp. RAB17]|uniref:hypothetical protein n=1 Tax=Chitinophaga sp. RAB17 TaxID=3233049 RepID=UPI003F938F4C
MAKQMSILPFTGKLGPLIGYRRNGNYFLRSMPQSVQQTAATRRASRRFGIASRKGALIRHAFYPHLDIHCDGGHINRLNRLLIAAGDHHAAITGFRFNQHTGVDRFFTVAPRLCNNGILHIPAQTIAGYKDITALEVKVIATRIDFTSRQVTGSETVTLMIDPATTFQETNVSLYVPGPGSLVVVFQVRAMYGDGPSGNRQYMAADIIAVAAPQVPKYAKKRTYPKRTILPSLRTYTHAYPAVIQLE